jgi:acylphosphatase
MNKCIKITLRGDLQSNFLYDVIQKYARKYGLEGLAQCLSSDQCKIIVCGDKQQVDIFVETIHKESPAEKINGIEVEPFLKDRDYRGVFRVIE